MVNILAYDIGTTGVKTCLFQIGNGENPGGLRMIASASAGYGLYTLPDGGAEQHADEWWQGMVATTREIAEKMPEEAGRIAAISFCSQMQGLVLVDEEGREVRHPMSYMDQRSKEEFRRGLGSGVKVAGMNARKLLKSLQIISAVSASVKDPMWKYLWVRNHEPENFSRARWWLDVKDYLASRLTGRQVMTTDSAYATMLYDTRPGKEGWSGELCRLFGVDERHLPPVIRSTDVVGGLREEQAAELGLKAGIPVFGGGGDASLIGIGAGAVHTGDTHVYCGTSGWVSTVVDKQYVDTTYSIGSPVGAQEGKYNYFAEMETAGKSLEWVRDHLALDEVGMYIEKKSVAEGYEARYTSLYEYLSEVIGKCPAGSNGVIFTPWMHGNRCPFEDSNAAGIFFNITLDTGKTEMIRAVTEGVCFHLRWMLECEERKVSTSDVIRFCGGGALSPVTCQILADITGRTVEVVADPQNVGSVGAALIAAVGLGELDNVEEIAEMIPVTATYTPQPENKVVYDRNYKVFKQLYNNNKKSFAAINAK